MGQLKTFNGTLGEYQVLHQWVRRKLGRPQSCEMCGSTSSPRKRYEWANVSGEYRRDLTDWKRLCTACHRAFDQLQGLHRGCHDSLLYATECLYGHRMVLTNLYLNSAGYVECMACRREQVRRWYASHREKVREINREYYRKSRNHKDAEMTSHTHPDKQ